MFFKKRKDKKEKDGEQTGQQPPGPPGQAPAGPPPGPQAEAGGPAPPSHPAQPMFKEAMGKLNNEQYDEAISGLTNIRHQYPDFEPSMVLYGLGVAHDGRNQTQEAIGYLQQSVEQDVGNFEAHIFLGNLYAKEGRRQDAIAEFDFVIQNNPEHELVPGLKATIEDLRNFSSEGAREKMVEEVEAFRHLVKQQFNVDLDYSPQSLDILNMIMDSGWNDVSLAGAYIGEVIVRNLGGQWNMVVPREESTLEGLGMEINPFEVAQKKVEYGKRLSISAQYKYIHDNMTG